MNIISIQVANLQNCMVLLKLDAFSYFVSEDIGNIRLSYVALTPLVDSVMFIGVQYDV